MNIVNFIMGILTAVVGLLLVIIPSKCLELIVILLGAGAIVNGVYDIFKVRILLLDPVFRLTVLIEGLVSIVIGVLAISLPIAFAGTVVTVMLYVLGVYLILCAIAEMFQFKMMKDQEMDAKNILFKSLGTLVIGIIMFFLPSKAIMEVLLRIIGAGCIIGGGLYSFYVWKDKPIVVDPEDVRDADSEKDKS